LDLDRAVELLGRLERLAVDLDAAGLAVDITVQVDVVVRLAEGPRP
jgi:hypothetical protein